MGSWSIGHWLIVLAIVLLIFGTRRLRSIGGDLGGAIRGFREGVREPVAASATDVDHKPSWSSS